MAETRVSATTVAGLFLERVKASPNLPAYQYREGPGWQTVAWGAVGERVENIARGLRSLGLADEERCAVLAGTRFEWIIADKGILCAGGATTTIYPSSTSDECAFILRDSGAAYVFAENRDQLNKLLENRHQLPQVRHVILFDGEGGLEGFVLSLAELEQRGAARRAESPGAYELLARSVRPESLATLIYTSGTTGKPKGVRLTHDCWVYEAEAIDALKILGAEDVQYLWLPLAHSFGKVLEVAQLRIGFMSAVDGKAERLMENLATVRPTFIAVVPRILEKIHNKVVGRMQEEGGYRLALFRWAVAVGRRVSRLHAQQRRPGPWLALQHQLAKTLVYSKLHQRFGGRLRYFICGSAPLSEEIAEFFYAIGILTLEGYGLTESSAATFVNRPDMFRFGTVGPPMPGTELRIAPEDGEILIRGRGIMRGYHGLPEATAETLSADGWLRTGDIGRMEDGFLRITDRKKDLIKTSGGKYVAPQLFEGKLKAACPYVSHVLVHGNNRNFCTALISLDAEAIGEWATAHELGGKSLAALASEPSVKALVQLSVDAVNKGLAAHESVRKFALLPEELSLQAGELTPSLKVKRKEVEQKYRSVLEAFYTGSVQPD